MINVAYLKLNQLMYDRDIISSDTVDLIKLKLHINNYVYPLGSVYQNFLIDREIYFQYTYTENITYFFNIFKLIFTAYYSEQECYLLAIFFTSLIYEYAGNFNSNFVNLIEQNFINSNKIEINYIIEELKFKLAFFYLLQNNRTRLSQLITELELIEDEHNDIDINATYDKIDEVIDND